MEMDALRIELVRAILDTDDRKVLDSVRRTLRRAKEKVTGKRAAPPEEESAEDHMVCEDETEYITKEEILDGIREGLTEMYRAKRTGERLKTLQEVIDEMD